MKNFLKKKPLLFLLAGFMALPSVAQEVSIGAELGTIGTTDSGVDPAFAYGAFLQINPYEWMGVQVDFAFTEFEVSSQKESFFFVSPAALFFVVNYEEFRVALLPGTGFYRLPNEETKFGLSGGASAELSLGENFMVGLQSRYHGVFGADDFWSVLMKAGFRFNTNGGWDW